MNTVVLTGKGRARDPNQNTVFAENHPVGALLNLYIVADETGRHHTGDYCFQTLAARVVSAVRKNKGKLPFPALRDAVLLASESLFTEAKHHAGLEDMGSTLVVTFLEGQSVTVPNTGDSRCYVGLTDGSFRQVTRDHSYVEEMVSAGKIQCGGEAYKKFKNIIVRVIGASAEVQMGLFELSVENLALLLLCTDRLTNILEDAEIREILSETITLKEEAEKLTQTTNMKGGRDNISVVLVGLREEMSVQ